MYLEKVANFMTTFGQPVLDKPTELPEDRQKLRIALIFEELKEYAESSGQLLYFNNLCINSSTDFFEDEITHVEIIDQVEQLDALLDLQYVLSGAVHEHGFGNIFDKAFEEVDNSNMSKACASILEAQETCDLYHSQNIDVYYKYNEKTGLYLIYRKSDNKVLKSHKYKPAQLAQFLIPNEENTKIKVYLTFKGIDDFHRAIFKDKNSSNYYGDCNSNKTGKPQDVIDYYKINIDKLEFFGNSFNCEPQGGINPNIKLIIE